jgi:hypothetical protein
MTVTTDVSRHRASAARRRTLARGRKAVKFTMNCTWALRARQALVALRGNSPPQPSIAIKAVDFFPLGTST